jgi:CotS family spore coat protein
MVDTDKGKKCLKRLRSKSDDFEFVYNVIKFLTDKGFSNVEKINLTTKGNMFVENDTGVYILSDMIDGRECDFKNPVELKKTVETMANFHKKSIGFKVSDDNPRNHIGKWMDGFEDSKNAVINLKKVIEYKSNRNYIDEVFTKWAEYYIDEMQDSIKRLTLSKYDLISERRKKIGGLCHNDFIGRNFIIDNECNVNFIDFDYCIVDSRLWDISKMLLRIAKDNHWDMDVVKFVIDTYNAVYPIDKDELFVIYCVLCFPTDFVNIVRAYYINKKDWTEKEFERDIERKVGMESSKELFLIQFKAKFLS